MCICMFGNNRLGGYTQAYVCQRVHFSIYIEVYSSCVQLNNTNNVSDRFLLYWSFVWLFCYSVNVFFFFFCNNEGKMILKGSNSSPTPAKHPWCLAALDPYKRH